MMANVGRYSAKRNLCRWKGTNKLERAMISLILIAMREGKELGWDEAARCTDEDASGEAFKQMLMKRKAEYLDAGYPVPARCAGRKVKVERDPYAASDITRAPQNNGFVGVNTNAGSPVTLKKKRQVRARNAVKPVSFEAPVTKTHVQDFNTPMTLRGRTADTSYVAHGYATGSQEEDPYAGYPVGVGAPESDSDEDYVDPEDRPKLQTSDGHGFNGVVSLKVPYTFKQGKTLPDNDDFEVLRPVQPMTAQNAGNIQNIYSQSNDSINSMASINTMGYNRHNQIDNTQALNNFGYHNTAMNNALMNMSMNGSGFLNNLGMNARNNSFITSNNTDSPASLSSSQTYFDDAMDPFNTNLLPNISSQFDLGMGGEVQGNAFSGMNLAQDMWSAAPSANNLSTGIQGPPTLPFSTNTASTGNTIDLMPSAFPDLDIWQNLHAHQVEHPEFSLANVAVNSVETQPFDDVNPVWDANAALDEFSDNKIFE